MSDKKVGIILSSTRPNSLGPDLAKEIMQELNSKDNRIKYSTIDLKEINLPFIDEPDHPIQGHYVHQHTIDWSNLVKSYDGFIFLMPQLHSSYPGILKNALDFLHSEWQAKPYAIITYGRKPDKAPIKALSEVLISLQMIELNTKIIMTVTGRDFSVQEQIKELEKPLHQIDSEFSITLSS